MSCLWELCAYIQAVALQDTFTNLMGQRQVPFQAPKHLANATSVVQPRAIGETAPQVHCSGAMHGQA